MLRSIALPIGFLPAFFFFNDTATTEIYTLSLHDALPILPDLALETVSLGAKTAQLELHWNIAEVGDELSLQLTYSTDLYDEPLIDRLLEHYDAWLRAFAERPEARLGEVAAEIAQATRVQRAERGLELKTMGRGKLRSLRRQATETTNTEISEP